MKQSRAFAVGSADAANATNATLSANKLFPLRLCSIEEDCNEVLLVIEVIEVVVVGRDERHPFRSVRRHTKPPHRLGQVGGCAGLCVSGACFILGPASLFELESPVGAPKKSVLDFSSES